MRAKTIKSIDLMASERGFIRDISHIVDTFLNLFCSIRTFRDPVLKLKIDTYRPFFLFEQ